MGVPNRLGMKDWIVLETQEDADQALDAELHMGDVDQFEIPTPQPLSKVASERRASKNKKAKPYMNLEHEAALRGDVK